MADRRAESLSTTGREQRRGVLTRSEPFTCAAVIAGFVVTGTVTVIQVGAVICLAAGAAALAILAIRRCGVEAAEFGGTEHGALRGVGVSGMVFSQSLTSPRLCGINSRLRRCIGRIAYI